jgi:4-diphosphocytidyl-2-C-methyl-D-erythritol kinase
MNETWSEWPAPAKLNLFLQIVGRRADGYHQIQTVFQLLDWGDRISLRTRADGEITLTDESGIPSDENLAFRAAQTLKDRSGAKLGVDIVLEKRIPMGGGLGGGSSDAATVLLALNELWRAGMSTDALAGLGLALGADVPVFVRGHSAWAEGIGEKLTPIELPSRHFVIVDPKEHVSTAELFQAAELTRNSAPTTISAFLDGICTANAFTPVVRARSTKVAAALDWLGQHGAARLSGSGGCIFAAMDSRDRAEEVARACPAEFGAYVAAGVNRSPLFEALDRFRN